MIKLTTLLAALCCAISARAAPLALFEGRHAPTIRYAQADGAPIRNAAALLAHDLSERTGETPMIASDLTGRAGGGVIIGRADTPMIAALLRANHIDPGPIAGKWESYGRAVIPAPWNPRSKALLIFGSDVRGTVWGVVDLTREIGVSPWEWWADVRTRKANRVAVSGDRFYSKEPSVKYRGFFINSSLLRVWAAKSYDPAAGGLGPKTYSRVFELMWRLKANMLWPGMNEEDPPFNADPANYDLARDYAIMRGTSHVEMLLRNNGMEWDPKTMGPYNWVKNKDRLIGYWRGAVERWGAYDNLYTIGMRGADDFPMEGADTAEKMGDVLHEVVMNQRRILSETLHKPADQIPQVFTPYKEITAAYNTGRINLPPDVTIIWPDDNYGYLLQLSDAKERQNPGGSGVYYHATFWGAPANYLFLGSTDPTLMWEEMSRSYHFGARNLWVLNVGNIKPVEYLNEFFLAMAFDMPAFAKPQSVRTFLDDWSDRNFGKAKGHEIAEVMWRYYKLAFDRNPEFMGFATTFPETAVQQSRLNITDFGDENARRAEAYKAIMSQSERLMAALPDDRKAAFYELVDYTVNTGGNMSLQELALDKSIAYGLQRRASANAYAEQARVAHQAILDNVRRYNEVTAAGKWNGIVSAYPQSLPNYLAPAIPNWSTPADAKPCGTQVDGGGYFDDTKGWWFPTLPTFKRELGERSYYLDIFSEQPTETVWTVSPSDPWIKIPQQSGRLSAAAGFEQRLMVSIDWTKAPRDKAEGLIHVTCGSAGKPIDIHVRIAPPIGDKAASFVDAQGVVSIYTSHADEQSAGWRVLPGVGHVDADVQSDVDMAPLEDADWAKAPKLLYRFAVQPSDKDYSFPNYVTDDVATIKVVGLPLFPATKDGRLRIALALDGARPQILDFKVAYYGAKWRQNVLNNAATVGLHDLPLKPGSHKLEVYALDPGVTLDRIEIRLAGAAEAYGPIPETRIVH